MPLFVSANNVRSLPDTATNLHSTVAQRSSKKAIAPLTLPRSVQTVRAERKSSDEDSDIELQDLAESLLEKLVKIWVNQN